MFFSSASGSGGSTYLCLLFHNLGLMNSPVENSLRFKLYVTLHLTGHFPEEFAFADIAGFGPISTIVLAAIFLNEHLTVMQLFGALIVIVGILMVSTKRKAAA